MNSAIYEGAVLHERTLPRAHRFRFRLFWMYLDLEELDTLFRRRWLWSIGRPNLACFRRADYLSPDTHDLRETVLERVARALGRRPDGAVRMLTHLRTWGHLFNPVTFYYCFDLAGELDSVVAEITNTPWRERHAYVLDARQEGRFPKDFHVSPFFDIDQEYEWRVTPPGEELEVQMTNYEAEQAVFSVGLRCRRRPLGARSLAWMLVRYPFQTLRIHAAIYWQAARLFAKRTPFYPHPDKRAPVSGSPT